jgi:hypothetical protein
VTRERLERDQDDDKPKEQQTEHDTDRQLVDADADAEEARAETVHLGELGEPLLDLFGGPQRKARTTAGRRSRRSRPPPMADPSGVPNASPMSGIRALKQ